MKMTISQYTSRGRQLEAVTSKQYQGQVVKELRALVRETSYNLSMWGAKNLPCDEMFSLAACLRQQAVDSLKKFDPDWKDFVGRTYQCQTFLHEE